MTDIRDLGDMFAICQMQYAKKQQEFAKLVSEENRLRAEISRLEGMAHSTNQQNKDNLEMQAIGADMIWQGWLGRAKTAINLNLAKVMAQKEHHLGEVRLAYGKLLVIQEMQAEMQTSKHKKRSNHALLQAIDMTSLI